VKSDADAFDMGTVEVAASNFFSEMVNSAEAAEEASSEL
jgi:hypothetical protein